jgi:hypothetical protein
MRILLVALMVVFTAFAGASVRAADLPEYPDVQVPEVDYGLQGGFYLRGSAGANLLWSQQHVSICGCGVNKPTAAGYGYSIGAGFGYEMGNGLRVDGTVDYLSNDGLTDGINVLHLRAGVALANAYYDIPISGGGSAGGGFGAYLGAGVGAAWYATHVTGPNSPADGGGWSPAVAAMAGVTYDAGTWVADLGYRLIYMPKISNYVSGNNTSFYLNDNTVHEIRGTVRYRFQ